MDLPDHPSASRSHSSTEPTLFEDEDLL
jgi:hypothetical protein